MKTIYVRNGMKFFDVNEVCVKTCGSVNKAKRHSREMQKAGVKVQAAK